MTTSDAKIGWKFDNTYSRLPEAILTKIKPVSVKNPEVILFNHQLSSELSLNFKNVNDDILASIFSGNSLPSSSSCIAQAYAGHQFGHFTILGDGRAIVIGEHINKKKQRFDIQFKGSGKTPYSRHGDGRAALGPMLREYIISEAMNGLNIPTTRSLAVVSTGEEVIRETPLKGAILTRVASSHIRVGTFQYMALMQNLQFFKILLNYTIKRHYPEIIDTKVPALELLKIVIKKQNDLVVNWMRVGFIHGVMNTDNVTISGETIDYGPCAFMDQYNPKTVFSSIDYYGRYSYSNQPLITKWNLSRFAETLLPFIDKDKKKSIEIASDNINTFDDLYYLKWNQMMRKKLGFIGNDENDDKLIKDLLNWMENNKADYTNTFLYLTENDFRKVKVYENKDFIEWKNKWEARLKKDGLLEKSKDLMKKNNPCFIPRNHIVEKILTEADEGNFFNLKNFIDLLKQPYNNQNNINKYQSLPGESFKDYKTYCGT
tara:strand:+ start:670 stop:2133 length:1464 start_codon:yes stop_codon:yes gene_type:complete